MLLAHVIRDAIERGRRRFDFLRGEERYKYEFGPTPEAVHCRDDRGPGAVSLRVAVLSVHTCPLAALGGKETGGMNVYVRELGPSAGAAWAWPPTSSRARRTRPSRASSRLAEGVRVVHLPAGPQAPMAREAVHDHLDEFVDGVEDFRIATASTTT